MASTCGPRVETEPRPRALRQTQDEVRYALRDMSGRW